MRKIASYISTFISAHPRWAMAAAVLLISGLYLPALGHQTTHQDFEKHCPICSMLSLVFLFLPVALLSAWLTKGTLRLLAICASSWFFYAYTGHAWYLAPLLFSSVLDFTLSSQLPKTESPTKRRALLAVSMCGNLGLLIYFKYWALILSSIQPLIAFVSGEIATKEAGVMEMLLPAGISFYTFQTMSYTIDVYRRRLTPAKSFWEYLAYVSFFPQLVAGPIARYSELGEQITQWRNGELRPIWHSGVGLFAVGLAKKVLIADRLANSIDPIIFELDQHGAATCWLALLGYSLQIYFDFSGYSDMAVGLGRCFGLNLPQNFHSPYKAVSPSDFWKRWHITLSEWIRDYVYIPLGGNRGSPRRVLATLVVTMGLGGLWHGASWTFVVWGLYHGILLAIYHHNRVAMDAYPVVMRRGLTFLAATLGWVFFRADTFSHALTWFAGLLGGRGISAGFEGSHGWLAGLVAVGLLIAMALPNAYETDFRTWRPRRWLILGTITSAALLMMNYSSTFIYYRF